MLVVNHREPVLSFNPLLEEKEMDPCFFPQVQNKHQLSQPEVKLGSPILLLTIRQCEPSNLLYCQHNQNSFSRNGIN